MDDYLKRDVHCVSWHPGISAYWQYKLEVPVSCWSKFYKIVYKNKQILFVGINCTVDDLDTITASQDDVKLTNYNEETYYNIKLK